MFVCCECGHKLRSCGRGYDVTCPKCGSTDIDVDPEPRLRRRSKPWPRTVELSLRHSICPSVLRLVRNSGNNSAVYTDGYDEIKVYRDSDGRIFQES